MKRIIKTTGILLLLMLAGNGYLMAQRGMGAMRGMRDTTRAVRPGMRNDFRQQPMQQAFNRRPMYGWGRGMGMGPYARPGQNNFVRPGMRGFNQGNMRGFGPGMGRMHQFGQANGPAGPGQGFRAFGNIPNLTEKQKSDITALQQKQQEEMKALRDDAAKKMQSLRDDHRKKIMNLLTDEQKNFVESRQGNGAKAPAKNK